MVLCLPPSSQSNHVELGSKIGRVMARVVSEAVPERAVADDSGTSGAMIAGGVDTRPGHEGQPFGSAFVFGGGWGATATADGISYCQSSLYNCRAVIVEFIEKSMPVVIWEHARTIDSAGPGQFRGGFGAMFAFEAISDTYCTPIVDSSKFPAEGLDGGGGGTMSFGMLLDKDAQGGLGTWNGLVPADRITPLFGAFDDDGRPDPVGGAWGANTLLQTAKPTAFLLRAGQIMRIQVACAAGYGDPLDREPAKVLDDVANELVSPKAAADIYGVQIDLATLTVDEAATRELRDRLRGTATAPRIMHSHQWPLDGTEFDRLRHGGVVGAKHMNIPAEV
jgi:N-methylhydantoinase B